MEEREKGGEGEGRRGRREEREKGGEGEGRRGRREEREKGGRFMLTCNQW